MKYAICFISILVLFSCSNEEYFKIKEGEIRLKDITRIDYYDGKNCSGWSISETPKYTVTDKMKIKAIVEGINYSNSPAPWKGACFDKICIVKSNDTIILSTNGEVVGYGNTGEFYQFQDPNFITTNFK